MSTEISFAVFTKPWRDKPLVELARFVSELGFDAVELPVRPGFQVEPDQLEKLAQAVALFADRGIEIASVAGEPSERLFEACARSGIRLVRTMVPIPAGDYVSAEGRAQTDLQAFAGLCEQYGVRVGVQQHWGEMVSSSIGLRALLGGIASPSIVAIWDAAHDGLAGMPPESGLDEVWDRLAMVNLKNAYWKSSGPPETADALWEPYFTTGRHGQMSWPRVADELVRRHYHGTICLTAEYSDVARTDTLCRQDLQYAKSLFASN